MSVSPEQRRKLSLVIGRTFEHDDFVAVLGRYPGREEPATCLPVNEPKAVQASRCLEVIDLEGTLIPFLSRVVEQKWKDETFRTAIVGEVRDLVRASSDAAAHVGAMVGALGALTQALAASPSPRCPGPATCAFVRKSRPAIAQIVASLDQLDALKALHDSLHVLQVDGVNWLDEDGTGGADERLRETIVEIVHRLRDIAQAVESRLPAEAVESCRRCHATASAAAQGLASAAEEEVEYALAELRGLVTREPEIIDEAMFALSRDLPLRALRDLIESGFAVPGAPGLQMKAADEALRRLSEALRARILEHALWQATETRIRALAGILGNPTGGFLRDLFNEWSAIRLNLRSLLDAAPNTPTIDLPLNAAIVLYERALPIKGRPASPGPSPQERLAEMEVVFDEFRLKASQHFLAVDKALKAEFASLPPLRDSLLALEGQVSLFCDCS